MNASRREPHAPPHELGQLLRYWRDVRGVSQLDLSLDAGISQRQICASATRCCSRPAMRRCIRKRRGMRRRCRA
jgi:hypothetical protein